MKREWREARPSRRSKESANSRIMGGLRNGEENASAEESVSDAPSSPFYSPPNRKRRRHSVGHVRDLRPRRGHVANGRHQDDVEEVNGVDDDEGEDNGVEDQDVNGVEDEDEEDEDEGVNGVEDGDANGVEDEEDEDEVNGVEAAEEKSLRSSRQRRRSMTQRNLDKSNGFVPLRRSSRTRRQRLVLDTLNLESTSSRHRIRSRRSRLRRTEIRNLDKYSTDDEFKMSNSDSDEEKRKRSRRRNMRKYNMRVNRQQISRLETEMQQQQVETNRVARKADRRAQSRALPSASRRNRRDGKLPQKNRSFISSSSSASSAEDEPNFEEDRFERRKTKRMNIERRKLLPLNLCKEDVLHSAVRDRQKIGASLADVAPMELDLNTKFTDVGGLESHVSSLKEMVLFPLLYPDFFTKFGVSAPRGVLFHGPPGTGKTLVARALACECSKGNKRVAFFMRKGADCLSKWIGESERQLRMLFDQAFLMRPSIIFFDEIDGLAPVRSSRQDQIHSSIVSTLLALMDGLDSRGEVIVIGATNRLEHIDPALRRPGRFDRELRFDLPVEKARFDILTIHTKNWKPKPPQPKLLQSLAQTTSGYCGADLKGLCAEAALNALRRRYPQVYSTNEKLKLDLNKVSVRESDFHQAMQRVVPSSQRSTFQVVKTPLAQRLLPLLSKALMAICEIIRSKMSLEAGKNIKSSFGKNFFFKPRLLLCGPKGACLDTYLVPAVLHQLESLPCHKIDFASLCEQRSIEETVVLTFRQAVRTAPSCVYISNMDMLWSTWSQSARQTLLGLLNNLDPTSGVLLLATGVLSDLPTGLFKDESKEIFNVGCFDNEDRQAFFQQVADLSLMRTTPDETQRAEEAQKEQLEVVPIVETRKLSEKENKKLRKKEEAILRELRIFLRDAWAKINREQKFFMFRSPVDTKEVEENFTRLEVYDYLEMVEHPMDLQTMMNKLDNGEYVCAQHFLDDIDLIADNALTYNNDLNFDTNRIICHRAHALKDFAYALVKAEMDTDFEDECKAIDKRRREEESKTVDHSEKSNDKNDEGDLKNEQSQQGQKSSRNARKARVSLCRLRRSKDGNEQENDDATVEGEENDALGDEGEVPVIDKGALTKVIEKAVEISANWDLEQLEGLYFALVKSVATYAHVADRQTLPQELDVIVSEYGT